MKFSILAILVLLYTVTSCTIDKTNYETEISTVVTEHNEFKEVTTLNSNGYTISIEALNGTFYEGFNEIRLKITNAQSNEAVKDSEVTFLPLRTNTDQTTSSCPHLYKLEYKTANQYYAGYSVFTSKSNTNESWKLYISFTANNKTYTVNQTISVQEQTNKNLNSTVFTGIDGEQYCIALLAPQKPKIAENELVAGIYKYNLPTNPAGNFPDPSQYSYSEVDGYTLQIDPRMPEPSMGNHSSINNKNLTQQKEGLYYGIVNYTMTGNWTLNFIMLNQNGKITKGTKVATDFTPGIEGAKSDLYIDILF